MRVEDVSSSVTTYPIIDTENMMAQVTKHKAKVAQRGDAATRKKSTSVSRSVTASKLASAIESHMSEMGFTDQEKNERVSRFAERVNSAIGRHAKS